MTRRALLGTPLLVRSEMEEFGHGCIGIVEQFDAIGRMRLDIVINAFAEVVNGVPARANGVENQGSLGFDPVGNAVGVVEVGEADVHLVDVLEFEEEVLHDVFQRQPGSGERFASDALE